MKPISLLFTLSILLLTVQCKTSKEVVEDQSQSYYTKTATKSDIDGWISDNLELVAKIQATVFYRTYLFDTTRKLTRDSLADKELSDYSIGTQTHNESSSGTAVVLAESQKKVALLTANHIVNYPDTLWHNYEQSPGNRSEIIEAVSVNIRNSYSAFVGERYGSAELMLESNQDDLAVLSTQFEVESSLLPVSIQAGNSDRLRWADFVYAIGYPKGTKMITGGIVSKTNRLHADGFSTDISFNRGFSGGIVLAVNRKNSTPEWVGMLTSATADITYDVVAREMTLEEYSPDMPYTGPVFVKRKSKINYGMTHAVSIKQIRSFLRNNKTTLQNNGFHVQDF